MLCRGYGTNLSHVPSAKRAYFTGHKLSLPIQTPQTFFLSYIIAGLKASLIRLSATPSMISEVDRQQAWHLLSFALKREEAWPATRALILALNPKMEQAGYWVEWIPYLEKGIVCSQQWGDAVAEARLHLEIGYLWQRLGQYAEAEKNLIEALHQFQTANEPTNIALTLGRLANIAIYKHEVAAAEEFIQKAFTLAPLDLSTKAFLSFTAGHIQFEQRNLPAARRFYEEAMAVWQTQADQRRVALSLQNLGRLYMFEKAYQDALHCYQRATEMLEEIGDPANVAVVDMNVGITYSLLQRPETALDYYGRAERVFRRLGATQNLAHIHTNKGIEYSNLQEWSNAEQAFLASIALWKLLGNRFHHANAMDGLGLVYSHQARHQQAVQIFREAMQLLEALPDLDDGRKLHTELMQHQEQAKRAVHEALLRNDVAGHAVTQAEYSCGNR